jgi:hypothetical protein
MRRFFLPVFLLIAGCTPVSEDEIFLGMNFDGDRLEWTMDWTAGTWTVLNRDEGASYAGELGADSEEFEGFQRDAGGGGWFVPRAERGFASSVPTGEVGTNLSFAVSTDVDTADYGPLALGNYTCVRWRETADTEHDIVFMTLRAQDFSLLSFNSRGTHIEIFPFGESTIDTGEGEVEGEWEFFGLNNQEIRLESEGESWEGILFPGTALMLRSPINEGTLSCLWAPLPNTQLSVFDGDFYVLESVRDGESFSQPKLAYVDVFGDAGLYTRDLGGESEQTFDMEGRSQVYYVGNAISWQTTPESWIYQIAVSDFYLHWTQVGGAPGPDAPDNWMDSFGVGFHPRELHALVEN